MLKVLTLSILFLLNTASATSLSPCVVRIQSFKHNGEQVRVSFETPLRTEKECATLAKMHQSNFNPSTVKMKKVSYAYHQAKAPAQGPTFSLRPPHGQIAVREQSRFRKSR